jgi:predicted N-acetyltransferase YhbS
MFLFLDYTRFGFELVNQNMFEMKILKMTRFTYFVIFHLKMIVCQNVNLSHTYDHCFENHQFVI